MASTSYPYLPRWLHRHGVARTLSSRSGMDYADVYYLMESKRWTPRWLLVWAANRNFARMYAHRASQLYLGDVQRHAVAQDGTRRWSLHYKPTLR